MPNTKNKGHMDVCVILSEKEKVTCKICDKVCTSANALAGHIGAGHKMKMEDYITKYYFDNKRHLCPICFEKTRYIKGKYGFKKYCKKHANEARREWSKNNQTFDYGWKKGLTKNDHESIASQAKKISGKNNHWYGKKLPKEHIQKLNETRIEKIKLKKEEFLLKKKILKNKGFELLISFDDFQKTSVKIPIKCEKKHTFEKSLNQIEMYTTCPMCNISQEQIELTAFIKKQKIKISKNNRKIIKPKELDIFIKEHNLAIEYNGLYWHSEIYKNKNYHKNKTIECHKKNIQLFHIFSDEWGEKQDIVKSMLAHRMGKTKNKIYARKCNIKIVNVSDRREFFNKTHISGDIGSKIAFGLYHNNELVSCLSLRRPFHKKYKNYIEIARFSTSNNTAILGGLGKLSKIAKQWAEENGYEGILTYADMRFGLGLGYKKVGFEEIGETVIDYWYTDGKKRFNRFKFRAQNNKTEKEIAEGNGVYKVYGCGSKIYLIKF